MCESVHGILLTIHACAYVRLRKILCCIIAEIATADSDGIWRRDVRTSIFRSYSKFKISY